MEFRNILKKVDEMDNLYLGSIDDDILSIDIKENPSIIITGSTGTGKSILLDQILLQLINKYTSLELNLALVDTSGVEFNYYINNNYCVMSAINDNDKSIVVISKILKEIERRKTLLRENKCLTVDDYNKYTDEELPLLVLAIDDDKLLLRNSDMENMLSGIIDQIPGLNILLVLATSDIYNEFFTSDMNTLASTLISFDYVSGEDALNANIKGIDNLAIGKFKIKTSGMVSEYNNFDFDDKIIEEVLQYKNN